MARSVPIRWSAGAVAATTVVLPHACGVVVAPHEGLKPQYLGQKEQPGWPAQAIP